MAVAGQFSPAARSTPRRATRGSFLLKCASCCLRAARPSAGGLLELGRKRVDGRDIAQRARPGAIEIGAASTQRAGVGRTRSVAAAGGDGPEGSYVGGQAISTVRSPARLWSNSAPPAEGQTAERVILAGPGTMPGSAGSGCAIGRKCAGHTSPGAGFIYWRVARSLKRAVDTRAGCAGALFARGVPAIWCHPGAANVDLVLCTVPVDWCRAARAAAPMNTGFTPGRWGAAEGRTWEIFAISLWEL